MSGQRNEVEKTQVVGGKSCSLCESTVAAATWAETVLAGTKKLIMVPIMVPMTLIMSIAMATPLRETLFSMFIPKFMEKVDEEFKEERTELLSTISGGSVLDVGAGGGAYFRYFGKADRVVAIEPQTIMHPKLEEAAAEHGLVGPSKEFAIVVDMKEVTGTFDHIILGNVLCEVPNVDETLEEVDHFLQPGGKVCFSEHVAQPKGTWSRWAQDWFNPIHRHTTLGLLGASCAYLLVHSLSL